MSNLGTSKLKLLNLGCGSRYHKDWLNMDLNSHSNEVIAHNILEGIPLPDNECDAVYHSHLLEHIPKKEAENFLNECRRVLKPGGIIRVVVPDLENISKCYLQQLESALNGDKDAGLNYEWILLELYDQTVRNTVGGEMEAYLKQNKLKNERFVFERCGNVVKEIRASYLRRKQLNKQANWFKLIIRNQIRILKLLLRKIKYVRYLQIGKHRCSGEIHQWMYDRYSLRELLQKSGFENIGVKSYNESSIPGFEKYELDFSKDIIYNPQSLFMEAMKPYR